MLRIYAAILICVVAGIARGEEAAPQMVTSPLGKAMTLKFDDEFDAVPDYTDGTPYLDRSKWQTTFWQGSSQRTLTANGEAQYYMDKYYAGKGGVAPEQRPNPFLDGEAGHPDNPGDEGAEGAMGEILDGGGAAV